MGGPKDAGSDGPFLALLRHADRLERCPFIGAQRTLRIQPLTSENDPYATSILLYPMDFVQYFTHIPRP